MHITKTAGLERKTVPSSMFPGEMSIWGAEEFVLANWTSTGTERVYVTSLRRGRVPLQRTSSPEERHLMT